MLIHEATKAVKVVYDSLAISHGTFFMNKACIKKRVKSRATAPCSEGMISMSLSSRPNGISASYSSSVEWLSSEPTELLSELEMDLSL